MQGYSKIAAPLTQLLKKDSFNLDEKAQDAFEALKVAMTSLPVLAMPDFNTLFEVEADASGMGVGAVLMQKGRPIAYFSQKLSERQQHCSVYEKELMAIVLAVKKWQHYLTGQPFIINTDQRALKFLLGQRILAPDQKKWVTKLMGYRFDIKYKPGKENKAADALSRRDQGMEMQALTVWQYEGLRESEDEVDQDDGLKEVKERILTG